MLTLSCALGWVVAKVSRKLKHKSFITVIVSLAGLAIYYFFVFITEEDSGEEPFADVYKRQE